METNFTILYSNVGDCFYIGESSDINKSISIVEVRTIFPGVHHTVRFNDNRFVISPDEYSKYGFPSIDDYNG